MASSRGFSRHHRTPRGGRMSPLLSMQLLVAVAVVALAAAVQAVSAQYCDLAVGSWQRTTVPPLYTGTSCPFAAKSAFKCATNAAANFTWVTTQCVLPRFNATVFMQRLYNKSMAIVGDSLAENHWIGLRCAIHAVFPTVDVKLTWIKAKYAAFSVPSHKATIIYMSDPYLVDKPTSPLMKINPLWTAAAMKIDYVVINFGHWYLKQKLSNMAVVIQMRLATRTISTFLQSMYKGTAVFSTYSPTHPGTFCKSKIVLNATQFAAAAPVELGTLIRNAEVEELRSFPSVRLLDITPVSFWRGDAHPASECSHWCVPGVVDTWSAMLDYVIANPQATAAARTRILA